MATPGGDAVQAYLGDPPILTTEPRKAPKLSARTVQSMADGDERTFYSVPIEAFESRRCLVHESGKRKAHAPHAWWEEPADPESRLLICMPEEYTAEDLHSMYLNRLDVVISQERAGDVYWPNAAGERILIRDMSVKYKRNVYNFCLRRARAIHDQYWLAMNSFAATLGGDMSQDMMARTIMEHEDHVDGLHGEREHLAVGAQQWLRETPFMRELLYQIEANIDGPVN